MSDMQQQSCSAACPVVIWAQLSSISWEYIHGDLEKVIWYQSSDLVMSYDMTDEIFGFREDRTVRWFVHYFPDTSCMIFNKFI